MASFNPESKISQELISSLHKQDLDSPNPNGANGSITDNATLLYQTQGDKEITKSQKKMSLSQNISLEQPTFDPKRSPRINSSKFKMSRDMRGIVDPTQQESGAT